MTRVRCGWCGRRLIRWFQRHHERRHGELAPFLLLKGRKP